jgi:hypothetical protein
VRAPDNHKLGYEHRDTTGDFRLEITPQLWLRDKMHAPHKSMNRKNLFAIHSGIEAMLSELSGG